MKTHNFMPGEVKVTGGQLSIPELAIHASVDVSEITARQDIPSSDPKVFLTKCEALAEEAEKHFGPLDIQSNGFAQKYYWAVGSAEEALTKSLLLKDLLQDKWAKDLGMVSSAARLDFNFVSGNIDLHVVVQPVTFENMTVQRHNAPLGATRDQKNRVARMQNRKQEFPQDMGHALLLEIDVKEFDPPPNSLSKHFELLQAKADKVIKLFVPQS